MKVYQGLDAPGLHLAGSVLTIGNFDGVHRGHGQLLAQGGLLAADSGHPLVVLTFEPHPLKIVAPRRAPARLAPLEDKLAHLAELGADLTVVAKSTPELLALEPEAFVRDVIVKKFRPSHLVEGPSFGFGRGRRGNVATLRDLGRQHGFEVCVVGPVELEIEPGEKALVSSTLIRDLVSAGKVYRAALCLGRPYALTGTVVHGHRRGKELGYPTANIEVADVLIPPDGVYSGIARVATGVAPAAISIGTAPTFGEGTRQIEAFLLDFDNELYGQTLRMEFLRWLRPQEKYESPDALVAQMERDVAEVRAHVHDAEVARNSDGAINGRGSNG